MKANKKKGEETWRNPVKLGKQRPRTAVGRLNGRFLALLNIFFLFSSTWTGSFGERDDLWDTIFDSGHRQMDTSHPIIRHRARTSANQIVPYLLHQQGEKNCLFLVLPVGNLPSVTEFHRDLPGFTGFYWVLAGFTGFYRVLLGFTGFY